MIRLYAKTENQKRFLPVDFAEGRQVCNLIDATIFSDSVINRLQKDLENLNPGLLFQIKDIKTNKVLRSFKG